MPAQQCIQGRAYRRNLASAPLIATRSPDPAPTTTKSSRLDGFCHPLHHGQIAIARGTFRTSTPRGFLPWPLSDDGPGAFPRCRNRPSSETLHTSCCPGPKGRKSGRHLNLTYALRLSQWHLNLISTRCSSKPPRNLEAAVAMRNTIADPVRSARSAPCFVQAAHRVLLTFALFSLIAGASASSSTIAGPSQGNDRPAILLFIGKGTSPNDVAALERILNDNHLDFATADSNQFNQLSESQFAAHRLLIVPGGNFEDIGNGLTATTASNIRKAVRGGLNYLGICAGAFFAGSSSYNGLNLTEGVRFRFYALENRNIRKAALRIEIAGWVVLSGVHPEAPDSWCRGLTFSTSAQVDNAYAATLIGAALHQMPLPHY